MTVHIMLEAGGRLSQQKAYTLIIIEVATSKIRSIIAALSATLLTLLFLFLCFQKKEQACAAGWDRAFLRRVQRKSVPVLLRWAKVYCPPELFVEGTFGTEMISNLVPRQKPGTSSHVSTSWLFVHHVAHS